MGFGVWGSGFRADEKDMVQSLLILGVCRNSSMDRLPRSPLAPDISAIEEGVLLRGHKNLGVIASCTHGGCTVDPRPLRVQGGSARNSGWVRVLIRSKHQPLWV